MLWVGGFRAMASRFVEGDFEFRLFDRGDDFAEGDVGGRVAGIFRIEQAVLFCPAKAALESGQGIEGGALLL